MERSCSGVSGGGTSDVVVVATTRFTGFAGLLAGFVASVGAWLVVVATRYVLDASAGSRTAAGVRESGFDVSTTAAAIPIAMMNPNAIAK